MRIVLLFLFCFVISQSVYAQKKGNIDYRLSIGLNGTSESSDKEESDLEYAGLGWHVLNSFYMGSLNKWKLLVGIEETKSVTDLDNRFELSQANVSGVVVKPNAIESVFLKTGAGGQFILHYSQPVAIFFEGTINYNALIRRDVDNILNTQDVAYDMRNHWDIDLGFYVRYSKVSLGVTYGRNITDMSHSLSGLNKNVVSADLGYNF